LIRSNTNAVIPAINPPPIKLTKSPNVSQNSLNNSIPDNVFEMLRCKLMEICEGGSNTDSGSKRRVHCFIIMDNI
jgi:hypothetical protein